MSHESVITSLKRLIKHSLFSISPADHRHNLSNESDRAVLILNGAMVEDFILDRLKMKMSSLNRDEADRIFSFEGPCGSFANRLRMAHGLGIIERPMRKKLEIIKELRNVAAHCHAPTHFAMPEIVQAVAELYEPRLRSRIVGRPPEFIRVAHDSFCVNVIKMIVGADSLDDDATMELIEKYFETDSPPASPEKLLVASRQSRPRKAKKGRPPRRPRAS